MDTQLSLRRRAFIAVALTIGFYAFALLLSFALLFATYAQIAWADDVNGRALFFCLIGGLVILWSIIPRFERFKAPGPELKPDEHPELFAILRDVAAATHQEMPRDVYLIPEVNAYVSHRGSFSSRRIMGLGLALMQTVSIPQLRAIVAHEFGHYCNDDLAFAGWIYRTRVAIEKTADRLSSLDFMFLVLYAPFRLYAKVFVRITRAISRAQELAADRLAASVAGAEEMVAALVVTQRAGYAYQSYYQNEIVPVLSWGFRAPFAAGFARFLGAPPIAKLVNQQLDDHLDHEETAVDDTHPALRVRAAELGVSARALCLSEDAPRAVSLLRDLPRLEADLVNGFFAEPAGAPALNDIAWEEAGTRVFLPVWQQSAMKHAEALREFTAPRLADALPFVAKQVQASNDEDRTFVAAQAVAAAFAVRLHDLGWMCDATPGKPVAFTRDGCTIEPFEVVHRIHDGKLDSSAWRAECESAGLGDVRLT
ncbi:MAG: M48 family metalloprotease [Thermoanaerobaculia bacterium]